MDIKIDIGDILKQLEHAGDAVEAEINQAVSTVAHAGYAYAISEVQSKVSSSSNRQDYLKALSLDQIGPSEWVIDFNESIAGHVEKGSGSYNMRSTLLSETSKHY